MILRIVKRLDGLRSDVFPKGMILRIVKRLGGLRSGVFQKE